MVIFHTNLIPSDCLKGNEIRKIIIALDMIFIITFDKH